MRRSPRSSKQNNNAPIFGVPLLDWAWIFAFTFWRLIIAGKLGLGVDEAHYVLYGMRIDWSYFDHPPLTGWTHFVFYQLLGQYEMVARLPAILCGIVSSILTYRMIFQILQNRNAARIGMLVLNISFIAAALWLMFLPDTLLFPLVLWLIFIVDNLLNQNRTRDWLYLGLCLGLCGLTKYTAILLPFSLLGFLIQKKALRKLLSPWFPLAILIGLICVLPVLYWNQVHDWISFKYQSGHVMGGSQWSFNQLLLFIVGQLAAYSPFLILLALIGWIRFFRQNDNYKKTMPELILWIALPTLVFFAYTSLREAVLLHWTLMAWGLLLPLGSGMAWCYGFKKTSYSMVGITLTLALLAMLELTAQFIPYYQDWQSPYADLTGWHELRAEVQNQLLKEYLHHPAIAVPNWTLGSRANYYLSDLLPVYVLDNRFDQFDIWEGGPPDTKDVLFLSWHNFNFSDEQKKHCESIRPLIRRSFVAHRHPVNSFTLEWCQGYKP